MPSLGRRDFLLAGAALAGSASVPAWATAAAPGDAGLNGELDRIAEAVLVRQPELATNLGLDTGPRAALKSRLNDRSWNGVVADHGFCQDALARLGRVPDAALSPGARINRDVIAYALQLGRDASAFDYGDNTLTSAMNEAAGPYVVNQQAGAYANTPEFLDSQHAIETAADAEAYLERMHAMARALRDETVRLGRDAGRKVVAPDFILDNAVGQQADMLAIAPDKARVVESLARRARAKGLSDGYASRASVIVAKEIYPALSDQLAALKGLRAQAGHDAGVWRLPQGEAYYAWLLRVGTTTPLSADEVHRMGLEQDREIEARMDGLLRAQGLTGGSVGERMAALGKDPRQLFPDTDAGRQDVLDYLNGLIAAVRPRLSKAFTLDLKAPVDVKRVPVDIQNGAGQGYMTTGSIDGSRPSIYYINLKSTANWPKFSLPTLTYHETIPGHAWQGAYLTETGKLPLARIVISGFNAYVEGWALYAEQLGDEIGMYDHDWAGRLGYLQAQRFRAVRLVVDTGLHAKRWTREQAIDWAVQHTGRTREAMTSEIDRYVASPGQACGYKVGHTEINRLRRKAAEALGPRYDLRRFNDLVVETGAAPLTVLDGVVDGFIAAERKSRA